MSRSPRFHGDDGSDRVNALRREFEDWYVGAAFDYTANPIGSQNCDMQWRAWRASRLAAAPEGAPEFYLCEREHVDNEDRPLTRLYVGMKIDGKVILTRQCGADDAPSLDAEDRADSLMEAINCAARDLPDGWQIEIGVECGAGWVNLYEDGRDVDPELSTDDSLEEQVRDSIAFAIDAARAAEGKGNV